MFKKPKRNFRGRRKDSESGDENSNAVDSNNVEIPKLKATSEVTKPKKKKKEKTAEKSASVLSFDDAEHEEEVEFKIKKSSHSKKAAKQLKKELQKEKEERERAEQQKKDADKTQPHTPAYSAEHLKAMMTAQKTQNGVVSQNTLNQEEESAAQQEEEDSGDGKFNKSNQMMDFMKAGAIPDAATIHAIRKKRQLAREQGDYIPLEETEKFENEKSRLIREEEHDHSDEDDDDEPRMVMGVQQKDAQLRKMHHTILQAREEDESGSDHDWEEQQIRKARAIVPGNQTAASANGSGRHVDPMAGYSNQVTDMEVEDLAGGGTARKAPPAELPQVTMEAIIKRLKQNLLEASDVHRVHVHERDDLASRLLTSQDEIDGSDDAKARLERQYSFFQEMRGYVQDLVDCLNHKVPAIDHLEKGLFKQYQKYAEQFVKRRQLDVKDEAADALKMKTPGSVEPPPDPDKQRRIAERVARRARRKRQREAFQIRDHEEGMSTDDELKPSELSSFNTEKDRISVECGRLFEDVVDEFHQLRPIMDRFHRWKSQQPDSYNEAYIGLCLPKLFSPLIRLRLITWNPLTKTCPDFEESSWFESLIFYGQQEGAELDRHDADVKLMPSIIEKVLLPKLTAFVEHVWDPLSTQQTVRLVNLCTRIVRDYPTVSSESKNTKILMKAIMERMRKTLEDDVFMPLYPKPILEANKTAASFFNRQFWQCVKLLDNILKWHGIVSDRPLQELALDGLLNRYILLALQNSTVDHTSIYSCTVIVSTFPSKWLSCGSVNEAMPGLHPMCRYLVSAATTLDNLAIGKGEIKKKESRDRIKQLAKILVQLRATDDALLLADKYSFKLSQL